MAARPMQARQASGQIVQRIGAVALFLLFFVAFSRLTDVVGSSLHIPLVISAFSFVMALLSGELLSAFKTRIGIAFAAFSAWLVFAVPMSVWRGSSFELVFEDWSKNLALFAVAVALLATLSQIRSALRTLGYAFFAASLLGLFVGRTVDGRFGFSTGLYAGSNELATAMVQGCIFWWYMIKSPSRRPLVKVLSLIPLATLSLILLRTASRAGVIVLAVILVMIFLHESVRGRIVVVLIGVLGVGGAVALAPGEAARRIATIFTSEPGDTADLKTESAVASTEQRAYLLKRSVQLTLQHPIFGVGPGQFIVAENGMSSAEGKRGQWLGTHNTYTQISSENGIPALILFLATLWFCWKDLSAAARIHRTLNLPDKSEYLTIAYGLRMALVSYCVFFCFEHVGYDEFYPAVAGIIAAFARISRKLAANAAPAAPPPTRVRLSPNLKPI